MSTFRLVVLITTVACVVSWGLGVDDPMKPDGPPAAQAVPAELSSPRPLAAWVPIIHSEVVEEVVPPPAQVVEEAELRPNHPPFDQIPPMPMPWPTESKAPVDPGGTGVS